MQFSIDPERLRQIIAEEVTKFYVDETFLKEQGSNLEQELSLGQQRQQKLERQLELERELEQEREKGVELERQITQHSDAPSSDNDGRKDSTK